MHYHEFRAMNTDVILAAEGESVRIAEGFTRTESLVREYERRFTRFSEDSELSALNRLSGEWFQSSPDLYEVVEQAKKYYHVTGGLFNPGVLGALEQAGYNRSFDEMKASNESRAASSIRISSIPLPSPCPDFDQVEMDFAKQAIRLPKGLRIDLGGIAKGWIAEKAALYLSHSATACVVNAGGDQFACGKPHGEGGWLVAIEDPFDAKRDAAILSVPAGALATSTTTRRRWQSNGEMRHHLIDPRTGMPADTEWVSVTVGAEHADQAEVLAKALLIGGSPAARRLLPRYPGITVIMIDAYGKLTGNEKSKQIMADAVTMKSYKG